jgi:ribosomal protein S18 acetylase RimI-like enzyme
MQPIRKVLVQNDNDLDRARAWLARLPHTPPLVDFEEQIQLPAVRANACLWEQAGEIIALAYVDGFNNLWFEIDPNHPSDELEKAIMAHGIACIKKHITGTGESPTLDFCCDANDLERLGFAKRFAFDLEPVRTLRYVRDLHRDLETIPIPHGFWIRCVAGEQDVDALVALHRAAFGTENMTDAERLAIMRAPAYIPELALVAVAPNGSLCGFCICALEEGNSLMGFTDPFGVHPQFQKIGLGKAMLNTALHLLKARGARQVALGTSSENLAMQKLAERMGFVLASEKLWFSKPVR